jgi:hypothetical protein
MEVSDQLHAMAGTLRTEGWVSPRAGLDSLENRKISLPEIEHQPVLSISLLNVR